MSINLKTLTPDTSFTYNTGFILGADSQSASNPSIYSGGTVLASFLSGVSSGNILLNNSGAFSGSTLTSLLDGLGSAVQGNISYRGASSWALLAPGAAGNPLVSGGASANPFFATAAVWAESGTHLTLTAKTASDVPLVIKGASGQIANICEFKNSSGTIVGYIPASFVPTFGNIVATSTLQAQGALYLGATGRMRLREGDAYCLDVHNSTNAHNVNVFNTYTDASNWEKFTIDWRTTANVCNISTKALGTGVVRPLTLGDGTTGIGIGNNTPSTLLDIVSLAGALGPLSLTRYGSVAISNSVNFAAARGTAASPTALQSGDSPLSLFCRTYGGSTWVNSGALRFYAAENHSESARGTYATIGLCNIGSTTRTDCVYFSPSGYVGVGVTDPTVYLDSLGAVRTRGVTIANLPSASMVGAGTRHFVTDALAPTFGATVAAGGSVNTPVYSDGTNWKVG